MLIAWAWPVDPVTLGARLEAYAVARGKLVIFDICIAKSRHLPSEITARIAHFLEEAIFAELFVDCSLKHRCITNKCVASDHFSRQELDNRREEYEEVEEGIEYGNFEEFLQDYGEDDDDNIFNKRHQEYQMQQLSRYHDYKWQPATTEYVESLGVEKPDSFPAKLFQREFGLTAHFNTLPTWVTESSEARYPETEDENDNYLVKFEVDAYLLLPIVKAPINCSSDQYHPSIISLNFAVDSELDVEDFKPLSEERIELFQHALRRVFKMSRREVYAASLNGRFPHEADLSLPALEKRRCSVSAMMGIIR